MKSNKSKAAAPKVLLSVSTDADVHAALQVHCRRHPELSRSAVVSRALRQFLLPDYQEQRQRVLAATLDRLLWKQHNNAERAERELRVVREMLAMLVRTFYIHTPEIPEREREAAVLSGEKRFSRFLDKVIEQVGPGRSALERMPQEETAPTSNDEGSSEPPAEESPYPHHIVEGRDAD